MQQQKIFGACFLEGYLFGLRWVLAHLLLYMCPRSPLLMKGVLTEASLRLQHVLDLWGLYLLESLTKKVVGGWSICFWVSASPAAVLALSMEFCAESRHWLYKVVVMGRQVIAASSFVSAPVAPNLSVGAMLLCGIFHSILTAKQMKSE